MHKYINLNCKLSYYQFKPSSIFCVNTLMRIESKLIYLMKVNNLNLYTCKISIFKLIQLLIWGLNRYNQSLEFKLIQLQIDI